MVAWRRPWPSRGALVLGGLTLVSCTASTPGAPPVTEAVLGWFSGLWGRKPSSGPASQQPAPELLIQGVSPPDPPRPSQARGEWPWPDWAKSWAREVGRPLPSQALVLPSAVFGPERSTQVPPGAQTGLPSFLGLPPESSNSNRAALGQWVMLPLAPLAPGQLTALSWLAFWAGEFQALALGVLKGAPALQHLGLTQLPAPSGPRFTATGTPYSQVGDDAFRWEEGGAFQPWRVPFKALPSFLTVDVLDESQPIPTLAQPRAGVHQRNGGDLSAPRWVEAWVQELSQRPALEGLHRRRGEGLDPRERSFQHRASEAFAMHFAWHAPAQEGLPEVSLFARWGLRAGKLREEVQGQVGGMPVAWVQENLEGGEGFWQSPQASIPLAIVREDLLYRTKVFLPRGPGSNEVAVGAFGDNPTPTPVLPEEEPSALPSPVAPSPGPSAWINEGK